MIHFGFRCRKHILQNEHGIINLLILLLEEWLFLNVAVIESLVRLLWLHSQFWDWPIIDTFDKRSMRAFHTIFTSLTIYNRELNCLIARDHLKKLRLLDNIRCSMIFHMGISCKHQILVWFLHNLKWTLCSWGSESLNWRSIGIVSIWVKRRLGEFHVWRETRWWLLGCSLSLH